MAEGEPGSGHGDLAAGWNITVPIPGLDFHAAGPCGGTVEADHAPGVDCPCPGVRSGGLGAFGSDGSETGLEGSEEEETERQGGNGDVNKIDKGKGKERVEDGNVDGRKDRNKGGDGNRRVDGETLQ